MFFENAPDEIIFKDGQGSGHKVITVRHSNGYSVISQSGRQLFLRFGDIHPRYEQVEFSGEANEALANALARELGRNDLTVRRSSSF